MACFGFGVIAELLGIDGHKGSLSDGVASQDDDSYKFADMVRPWADSFIEIGLLQQNTWGHDSDED